MTVAKDHRNGAEKHKDVPVAIVGMACRLAGSATNPDALWQMLSRGKSGWSRGAASRFNQAAFHHPSSTINGAFNAQGMHLLKQDISNFDNQMFNISAIEAKSIDPQQRLLLEVAYEAFENAGLLTEDLVNSETGVYSAVFNHDYESIQSRDPEVSPSYRFTGTGPALVSNRISYVFDLKGPSLTIDTACSGSLVAIHQACQAIRSGEIRQALVGGTNLILDPEYMASMSTMQVLSDHGRCYAFDSRANGFGRGEGVAAIVVKRLDDAIRDGDCIRSIIRGSATNQDGRTAGITMPSHDAQVAVIQKAYSQAGLDPRQTTYVEAHGTGTRVGDKTEASALAEAFGRDQPDSSTLYIGSVKTNVGHTESTAGLAGLLKAVLVLENGVIPPNVNFSRPNDAIPWEKWQIQIPQKCIPWPVDQIQRVSVNSFGYGGSNAHVILDGIDEQLSSNGMDFEFQTQSKSDRQRLYMLTHNTETGIGKSALDFKRYIGQQHSESPEFLDNLAYTLNSRRSKRVYRVSCVGGNLDDVANGFDEIAKGTLRPRRTVENPKICFAFTGQGAQWAGMGKELSSVYPVFAQSVQESEKTLTALGADWSLAAELNKPANSSRINEARISQPCCTALQVALVNLLRSWNIRPDVVCGHSSGEIAAAYAAGYITAKDAIAISYHRGEAVHQLKSNYPDLKGGMLAVGLSLADVKRYVRHDSHGASDEKVVVACINSPSSVTLSGDVSPLEEVKSRLDADGVFNRMLVVDVAYHSHHMDLVRQRYIASMESLKPKANSRSAQMVSSVTGKLLSASDVDACYWADNMTSCVRFSEALQKSAQLGGANARHQSSIVDIIAELGPHSALAGPIKQSLKKLPSDAAKVKYSAAVIRNTDSVVAALKFAGDLACTGVEVNFDAINDPTQSREKKLLSNLPTYNWNHTVSHWNEGRASIQYRSRKFPRHDLLGVPCADSIPLEPKWRNYIRFSEMPWVRGHSFQGQMIFPASGYICAAVEAVRQVTLDSGRMWKDLVCRFRQIHIGNPLLIPDDSTGVETLFTLRQSTYSARESSSNWKDFRMFSMSETGEAIEHCRGQICVDHANVANAVLSQQENTGSASASLHNFESLSKTCRKPMPPKRFYTEMKSLGIDYTGPFANITDITTGSGSAICTISVPNTKATMPNGFEQPHCIHPATLDMCFHAPFTTLRASSAMKDTLVISNIEELEISSDIKATPATALLAGVSAEVFGYKKYKATVTVAEPAQLMKSPLINVRGLVYTSISEGSSDSLRSSGESLCHNILWAMDPAAARSSDVLEVCEIPESDSSATHRRDVYDAYAQQIIERVFANLTTEEESCVEPHFHSLLSWMRAHAFQPTLRPQEYSREIVESLGVDGKMLVRVGDHMLDILRGKIDALALLLEEDLLYEVYSFSNTHRCHDKLDKYLQILKFKNPDMDILEIGAGTAGTTVPVLEAFSTRTDDSIVKSNIRKYVFTDISSGFFEKSKEKLNAWVDIVEFKKLDVEADPATQGFSNGSFDLIIASNVLHATQSITHTLKNVRSLLRPGGKLIMVEITNPHMTWPMIVGTLPGWWLGAAEGRVDSPSLSCAGWDDALRKTGFTGLDVEMWDYASDYEHQLSVLVSTATNKPTGQIPRSVKVLCDGKQEPLARAISSTRSTTQPTLIVDWNSINNFEVTDDIHVIIQEATTSLVSQADSRVFATLKKLLATSKHILWITRGATIECTDPTKAMVTGLGRTARSEDHSLKFVTLDLDPNELSASESAQHIEKVLQLSFNESRDEANLTEFEYAVRNGVLLIPRIIADDGAEKYVGNSVAKRTLTEQPIRQPARSLELKIKSPGLLETFFWADSPVHSENPGAEEVRIRVTALPLNFKDLMTAMGQLEGLTAILIECGGVVEAVGAQVTDLNVGDRVCALSYKSLATNSNLDHRLVQRIPDTLSTEVAAAIQVSYTTALYCLRDVARLQRGESMLIHSAAGAFGQAAISLAQFIDAGNIYVTVGSAEKATFLTEKYGIPAENIFSSRNLSFKDGILRATGNRGVDVVINSLTGEAMFESYKCLARFGRFVEIGKKDLLTNTRLEMQPLEKNITVSTVDLSLLMQYKPAVMKELLGTVFDLISQSRLKILGPIVTNSITELEPTLRQMQTGKHIGKFVMTLDDEAMVKAEPPIEPLPSLNADASYLVVGGTGGLGKAIIKHLTRLGAKHIIAMSRSGAQDAETVALIEECQILGAYVQIQKGSVLSIDDIRSAANLAGSRSIRGVIQGAMVLKDTILSNMSYEQWEAVVTPKVQGTINLHTVFGENLDFFIMLSSGTGIIGSYGQGNYSAGGTFQDAFARWRTTQGLPARTIDLGPVEGEGYAAENEKALEFTLRQGMGVVKLEEVMALINHAISHPRALDLPSSQILAGTRRVHPSSGTEESAVQRADPKFSHLWTANSSASRASSSGGEFDFQEALRTATSLVAAATAAQTAIINKLSRLLAMSVDQINPESAVGSYGMDSLISVELRNWISTQLEAHVQQFELMSAKSIQDLAAMVAQRSRLVPAGLVSSK